MGHLVQKSEGAGRDFILEGGEKSHAFLSPSAASRWMNCPGAPHLEASIPDVSSMPAEEGTAAHFVAEMTLLDKASAPVLGDRVKTPGGNTFEVTQEMLDGVALYESAVNEGTVELDAKAKVEARVSVVEGVCEGTLDAGAHSDLGLKVWDFKYGAGVEVEAEGNEQARIYALGYIREFIMPYPEQTKYLTPDYEIELIIVQPRHFKSLKVKKWLITYSDLLAWADFELYPAIDRAEANAGLTPGEKQCHWCKAAANGRCPALEEQGLAFGEANGSSLELAKEQFPEDVEDFTPDQLARALSLRPAFKAYVKSLQKRMAQIEERSENLLTEGQDVPGFKRVLDRKSPGKWVDEGKVREMAESKGISPCEEKMKSVAKLRDEFIANGLDTEELLSLAKSKQGTVVVPVTDKKKALLPKMQPEELFKTA